MLINSIMNLAAGGSGGLQAIYNGARSTWLAPVFFIAVGMIAVTFLRNQQFTKLIVFLVLAAIIGCLIFFAPELFGDNGAISKMFKNAATTVSSGDGGLTSGGTASS